MTDKSFGDHTNRNIVKNPLLSTAVTGLSIEDLTHNAVLLPVSLSQEAVTLPDQQTGTQNKIVDQSDHVTANYPSGDAKNNPYPQSTPLKTETIEKPTNKTEDDFDVSEYFARLQGTRYVSAPLSSIDKTTNLAAEENLEEINLNEPEKQEYTEDIQQSITADIAQNFSQLPTMLPQVASAVFSSFSNMLQTRKSREPTPDARGYQEVHFERQENVTAPPMMMPPREPLAVPPNVGTANYRLPQKKKYAQIPGLSSGEHAQIPFQSANQNAPQITQNIPQYFVPNLQETSYTSVQNLPSQIGAHETKTTENVERDDKKTMANSVANFEIPNQNYDVYQSYNNTQNIPRNINESIPFNESNISRNEQSNLDVNLQAVLPPPPMFSNAPRRDSQGNVGKTILPPSVARRISGNQPIVKGPPEISAFTDSIFTPQMPESDTTQSQSSVPISQSAFAPFNPQSAFKPPSSDIGADFPPTASCLPPSSSLSMPPKSSAAPPTLIPESTNQTVSAFIPPVSSSLAQSYPPFGSIAPPPQCPPAAPSVQPSIFTPSFPTPASQTLPATSVFPPSSSSTSSTSSSAIAPPPQFSTSATPPSIFNPAASQALPTSSYTTNSSAQMKPPVGPIVPPPASIQPKIFTPSIPSTVTQTLPESMLPPSSGPAATFPPFFNPSAIPAETREFPPIANPTSSPPETVLEPPKPAGNVSFRMTKKRPQYYSGPIEGVGAISNNVKPTINPVGATSFQGALFTPQADATEIATTSQVPFDISRPVEVPFVAPQQMPEFNTPFDMSRQNTERYEEPKQDSAGFGLLGSLKSKLSSLDINKIQSSVTTFFDPAYNSTKNEGSNVQENVPYGYAGGFAQGGNFEVFVPSVEQAAPSYQPYQNQYNYNQDQTQYYYNQDHFNYHQNAASNYPISQSYDTTNNTGTGSAFAKMQENVETQVFTNTNLTNVPATSVQEIPTQMFYNSAQISSNVAEAQKPEAQTHFNPDQQNENQIPEKDKENSEKRAESNASSALTHSNDETNRTTTDIQNAAQGKHLFGPQTNVSQSLQIDTHSELKVAEINYPIPQDFSQNGTDLLMKSLFQPPTDLPPNTQSNTASSTNDTGTSLPVSQNVRPALFFEAPAPQNLVASETKLSENEPLTSQQKIEDVIKKYGAAANFFDNANVEQLTAEASSAKSEIEVSLTSSNSKEEIPNPLLTLKNNSADFFSSFSQGDATPESFFSKYTFDPDSKTTTDAIEEQNKYANEHKDDVVEERPEIEMSTAPLFGLSSILAETRATYLENEMTHMTMHEPKEPQRNTAIAFLDNTVNTESVVEKDLNICETCREVNKPEDRDKDDLTQQLIENITSPIQLSNAVEVPLTESNIDANFVPNEPVDFDIKQCAEISHITEETIEAMQVQSAVELLDDEDEIALEQNVRKFGWVTEDPTPLPVEPLEGHDYPLSTLQAQSLEPGFTLPIDPHARGFYGNNALFQNVTANDDVKPGIDVDLDSPIVMPRQMSLPTAPPEEDDTKSEGIDVHSIEQDAKKDFPIFEEFVIEPADNDDEDDDIVENTQNTVNVQESFTSRVDKYQKKDETETEKTPTLPMASYFDTGNYAVETHYRNSLTSPTAVSIPPGFEEEFKNRVVLKETTGNIDIHFIPDTSTQTRPTYSPTFSTADNLISCTTSVTPTKMTELVETIATADRLPDFTSAFGAFVNEECSPIKSKIIETALDEDLVKKVTEIAGIGDVKPPEVKQEATCFEKPKSDPFIAQNVLLPDPMNFFASSSQTAESEDVGFNRLASYFSSPAKTDNTKSFFELSQGQDHYRQNSTKMNAEKHVNEETQAKFKQLMNDLTSVNNAEFKPEQVVRTVNYFTIEYDNENLIKDININKGELGSKSKIDNDETDKPESIFDETDNKIADDALAFNHVKRCKHCNLGTIKAFKNIHHDILTVFKVKTCMDGNTTNTIGSDKEGTDMEVPIKTEDTRQSISVNFDGVAAGSNGIDVMVETNRSSVEYTPVKHHWFYRVDIEGKSTWRGFSVMDSRALEEAFNRPDLNDNTVVPTDGGRYDVNILGRLRFAVYWTDSPSNVRRCSWFYKGATDARYVPYTEAVAEKLEEEYRHGVTTGEWHRRLALPNNEMVVMHSPAVIVHFLHPTASDAFSSPAILSAAFGKRVYRNPPKIRVCRDQPTKIDHLVMLVHGAGEYRHQQERRQSATRPRVVRRGYDESEIEEMEPTSIDHLLLLCHGVGSACDMRFRNVEEVVDDFRATSLQLIQSHYKNSYESGHVGRVEVLPISWHATLHSGETGVDKRLARITLNSIPKLRNFTNDTVLDVLFYTSPVFCQTIVNTVCNELNRIYKLFKQRNPEFKGGVSLGGHSLGSVILYDLLSHQMAPKSENYQPDKRYVSGAEGCGQPAVAYPKLDFDPVALYALGSPIAIFECIRGVDSLGKDFALPTCKNFFNIFHPYDPIAYRIEPLINPDLRDVKPFLIPHHKGRKRMHLELKDTMARVGADIKQKLIESIKNTWTSMWKTPEVAPTDRQLEKVVEEEMEKETLTSDTDTETRDETTPDMLGKLNAGRRIDYVLQEAPFEMINEYLFAMSSHVCYWESEDTMLLMLREIYDALGVQPDSTVPQQSLTVHRTRLSKSEESAPLNAECPSTSRGAS